MNPETSPYKGLKQARWLGKTNELSAAHPLKAAELVDLVLTCWKDVFDSKLGRLALQELSELVSLGERDQSYSSSSADSRGLFSYSSLLGFS
jgi:hypothetical protein